MGTVTHCRSELQLPAGQTQGDGGGGSDGSGGSGGSGGDSNSTANMIDPGAPGVDAPACPMLAGITLSALLNHMDGAGSNHGRVFVLTHHQPPRGPGPCAGAPRASGPQDPPWAVQSKSQLRQFCRMYYGADGARADVLSPAEVSSSFQHCGGQPDRGVAMLRRTAARRTSPDTSD
jgi:hypothetical protein